MKVAVVGGGGFRTPAVWEAMADARPRVEVDEVVLHDVRADRLDRIADVIEGLRRERTGDGPPVRTTTALEDALDGAGAVFAAIRVGGLEGRIVDETVPLRCGVLGQETVGPGGIAFALRTVPVMRAIASTAARVAPDAWFLNFTNPAGLVTEAIRPVVGDRAIGICDSPAALCGRVAGVLRRPMGSLRFDYAGLNHLGWLMTVEDDGGDLLPALLADDHGLALVEEARLFGVDELRRLGMIPNEYLVYYETAPGIIAAFVRGGATRGEILARQQSPFYEGPSGTPEAALASWRATRNARHGTYMAEAWEGRSREARPVSDEGPGEAGYAAVAVAFLRAVAGEGTETLILNVPNDGRIEGLDHDAVVEVPCAVGAGAARVVPGRQLPSVQDELIQRIKAVERLTVRAAVEGSAALARAALAAHPLVPSPDVADRIMAGYLDGHAVLRTSLR